MSGIRPRATTYRGITMRSRLEADFAAYLDREGDQWKYEPACFAGPDGQWLPDFGVTWAGLQCYVEVKPESLKRIDPVLEQMEVAWLSEPGALLYLVVWWYGGDPERSIWFTGYPDVSDGMSWYFGAGPSGSQTVWPGMGQLRLAVEERRAEERQWAVIAGDGTDAPF